MNTTVRQRSARGFLFLYAGLVVTGGLLLIEAQGPSTNLILGVLISTLLGSLPFTLSVRALLRSHRVIATAWCLLAAPVPYLWLAGESLATNVDGMNVTTIMDIAAGLYFLASAVALLPFPLYIWLVHKRFSRPS